nr:PEPxxWA-CTERM sorting domain-containing protein [Phenylobacterium sp.]
MSFTLFESGGVQVVTPLASVFFFQKGLDAGFGVNALPSRGFSIDNYKYTMWSRGGAGNQGIADITTSSTFDAIPEPSTWAMMIGGFGLLGSQARRRDARILSFSVGVRRAWR